VENTHDAIISKDVFDQVQEQIASRRRKQQDGTTQIFAGLVKCADCGWAMSFGTNKQNSKPYSYFNCTSYRQFGKKHATCTAHYIRYDTLYTYVHARLMYWWQQAQADEAKLTERILKASDKENDAQTKARTASLTRAEKRKEELDRLFSKLYEDWASERITEYNFNTLSKKYQTEQEELLVKIDKLTAELSAEQQSVIDAEKWIASIKKCARPTELTADLLNSLIEKIVIHEGKDSQNGMKAQPIEIYYRFIGKID